MPTPSNRFIRAVSQANRKAFLADCETVEHEFSEELLGPPSDIHYVYFPTSSFISEMAAVSGRSGLEVSLVGREGMIGATLLLGVDAAPLQAVVQGAGSTLRMGTAQFLGHVDANPRLADLVKRYLFVQFAQLAQSCVCLRFHGVEARLARWLLMMQDRAESDRFHMTHEFLASVLGVRRVGITQAAGELHARGLINYRRGDIVVLDRAGLEGAACSCYAADAGSYRKWMG